MTREFTKRGKLKSILIEDPFGRKKKNTFDADGRLAERYVERPDKTWKHDIYNDGFKVTAREYDGLSVTTTVFDRMGRVQAISEDLM